jgi:hypothetical protein
MRRKAGAAQPDRVPMRRLLSWFRSLPEGSRSAAKRDEARPAGGRPERLDAWLDGELPPDEAVELERSLEEDPRARATLSQLRERNALVSTAFAWSDFRAESVSDAMRTDAGSGARRRPLGRLLERRAEANRLFASAREAEAGARPAEALAAVSAIFDLSDPRSLLGAPRLAELMDLAARCHAARAAEPEAAAWRRRAAALRAEG